MNEDLLSRYNAELAFVRRMGAEFAEAYPTQASNLGLNAEGENDPFVGRMVEAFALLNARTRLKLEDDFPELCGSMLETLYPHYQRPIPSMAIVQCELSDDQADLLEGHQIASGREMLTESVDGERCRYQTAGELTCWPLKVTAARYTGAPIAAPVTAYTANSAACLSVEVATLDHKTPLSTVECSSLRFFVSAQPPYSFELHAQLLRDLVGVVVAGPGSDPKFVCLDPSAVTAVGFDESDAALPCPSRSLPAYRLLTEYFAFREKFLFIDVALGAALKQIDSPQATLHFVLRRHQRVLEAQVDASTFRLGCVPIVNLYSIRAEQMRIDHREPEYRIAIDSRRPNAHEVYSIDNVVGTNRDGETVDFQPFYAVSGFQSATEDTVLWHASRHERVGGRNGGGTDVGVSFVDLGFRNVPLQDWTVDIKATCLSRGLPSRLPTGPGRPQLEFDGGDLARVQAVTAPTPTLRPHLGPESRWRLVSHLNTNHLSLADEGGVESLREILRLYDYRDSIATRKQITAVVGLTARPSVRMTPGPTGSVPCRGLSFGIELDPDAFTDGSGFLFASVLDHFIAVYATINSFTQTTLRFSASPEEPHTWPARIGELPLA